MANYFARSGNYVRLVSIAKPEPSSIFPLDEHVNLEYLNLELFKGNIIYKRILSFISVRNYLKNLQNQTYVIAIGLYPSILIAAAPSQSNIIKIGCQHSSFAVVRHIWYLLRKLCFRRLDQVVSLTKHDCLKLKTLNKNVCVIPNSNHLYPEIPSVLQNKVILTIGRIDYLKGYDLLLEVFSKFCLNNNDWKLKIIGNGPLLGQVENRIRKENLTDRISIITQSSTIASEYSDASIFILTSRSEGLPMVLLEAQAFGIPAIAFNCETGPSEIITDGKDGFLVENFNTIEMSKKLLELTTNYDLRREMGQNARLNAKKYLPGQIYDKWEILLNNLKR